MARRLRARSPNIAAVNTRIAARCWHKSTFARMLRRTVGGSSAAGVGHQETPNHVSDDGSFRRKRPCYPYRHWAHDCDLRPGLQNVPRQHARQRRAIARRVLLAVPPPGDLERRPFRTQHCCASRCETKPGIWSRLPLSQATRTYHPEADVRGRASKVGFGFRFAICSRWAQDRQQSRDALKAPEISTPDRHPRRRPLP